MGLQVIRWLQQEGAREWLAQVWEQEVEGRVLAAGGDPVASRTARYVALLAVADRLLVTLGWPSCPEAVELAWGALAGSAHAADRATAAAQDLRAWALAQGGAFEGLGSGRGQAQIGVWGLTGSGSMAILAPACKAALAQLGYQAGAVLRAWADRGWLDAEEGRQTRRVAVGSGRAHCVVLRSEAWGEAAEPPAGDQTWAAGGER